MQRDIGAAQTYRKAEDFAGSALGGGAGLPFGVAVLPDGTTFAAFGVIVDQLAGLTGQRIVLGDICAAAQGLARDRLPRWNKDGTRIAYLPDESERFVFRLCILICATGTRRRPIARSTGSHRPNGLPQKSISSSRQWQRDAPRPKGGELHPAISPAGIKNALRTYPGERHGVTRYPARIDLVSRALMGADEHMPVKAAGGR